jgi:hypothetical protein
MLADFGARVIKLEPKGAGDIARAWGTPLPGGETAYFVSLHRNKQGIEVDLKHPDGKALFFKLVQRADVVLENYRTGALERLGLAYEEGRKHNPAIIYCSVSGFGQDGPYRDRAALDLILQAESGMISVTGEEGGRGVRCGTSVADMTAGMYAAFGIMLALRVKEKTGRGQAIDVSMLEGQMSLLGTMIGGYLADGEMPRAHGHRLQGAAAVPDLPDQDARSGAGGGEREALAGVLPRHRAPGARERSSLPEECRPGPEPRHAHSAARGGVSDEDLRGVGGHLSSRGHSLRRHQQYRPGGEPSAGEGARRPRRDEPSPRGESPHGGRSRPPVGDPGLGAHALTHAGRAHLRGPCAICWD